jgi:hypothetical protein
MVIMAISRWGLLVGNGWHWYIVWHWPTRRHQLTSTRLLPTMRQGHPRGQLGVLGGAKGFLGVKEGARGCCCTTIGTMRFRGMLVNVGGFWGTTIGESLRLIFCKTSKQIKSKQTKIYHHYFHML